MSKSKININDVCDAFRKIFDELGIEEKLKNVIPALLERKIKRKLQEVMNGGN